ncbi:hypothetical protein SAMN05920897_101329 [Alkalispirochaeta americana]|uniref:Uncharacterized protein n=2 Tax=Alkalispirochaeta americana TaxID=159291 RepID=A0A1N6NMB1_9SPIO|nr:hypothetical protein SAMN05920897_101329 [Alkalispirochaeta americana]
MECEGADMRWRERAGALAVVLAVILAAGCQWETPEELRLRGTPSVAIPAGAVDVALFEELLDGILEDISFGDEDGDDSFEVGDVTEEEGLFTIRASLGIDPDGLGLGLPDEHLLPDGYDSYEMGIVETVRAIDLSELLKPVSENLELAEVTGYLEIAFYADNDGEEIEVRIFAKTNGDDSKRWLLGGEGVFESFESPGSEGGPVKKYLDPASLTDFVNAQSENGSITYELVTDADGADAVDSIELVLDIPFLIEATENTLLNFDDDNALEMDEDIFGRDPADPDKDLDDLLDALRGSSVEFSVTINNAPFDITLGMIHPGQNLLENDKTDSEKWFLEFNRESDSNGDGTQTFTLTIPPEKLDEMIDAGEFIPEFLLLLEKDGQIGIRKNLKITGGHFRATIDYDQTFEF